RMLPGLERRPCQEAMAQEVTTAFDQEEIALIEAGTGTGKTLAYLLPTIRSGKRVVISTHTINLQEQILRKDLPQILDALDLDIKAVLVKGMGNYVCLRKIAGSLD